MAYYTLKSCISEDTYVVDFGTNTPNLDEVWSFVGGLPGDPILCGIVGDLSDETPQYTANSLYNDCCECLLDNGYQSFKFQDCERGGSYLVSITTFCTGFGGPPAIGNFYKFYTEPAVCALFEGVAPNPPNSFMTPSTAKFGNCIECNNMWNAIDCITEETYTIDFLFDFGVGPGQVYSLLIDENIKCVTLQELVESPTGLTTDTFRVTCVECYVGEGFQSLKFVNCVDSSVIFVDTLNFYNAYSFIPLVNSVYELYVTNNNQSINGCFTFTEVVTDSYDTTVDTIVLEYNDCITCTSPKSANTESTVCVICSGNTFTVSPPHPVWTDNKGKAVIQLDAITLGGNGLNS